MNPDEATQGKAPSPDTRSRILGWLLVALVLILVAVSLASAWSQHVRQTRNLALVRAFIAEHGEALKAAFPGIDELFGYTGGGGQLSVIHQGELDTVAVIQWVRQTEPSLSLHVFRMADPP